MSGGCAVYLDDVVIYSDKWEEHLVCLARLLDHLSEAQLTVNLAKCTFAKATVTYQGKMVTQGNVRLMLRLSSIQNKVSGTCGILLLFLSKFLHSGSCFDRFIKREG